ncbi:MAG TPA: efflux RND transporter periplasmic adaptor subunit [Acidobacteriota bacterium]|nr:efflux RND transporter periplasmic adaptor subunit [Acidobacteriota bacterium]HQM63251.1 efflux RND transporter periplasmic adaptor subunit [Acidobacteriota bacterium]
MKVKSLWPLIAILALFGILAGCGGAPQKDEPPVTPVRVSVVQTYSTSGTVRYSASIVADEPVSLAFKNSGYIVAIHQVKGADGKMRHVQEGDWVEAGMVLVRIRDDDYTAVVQQARAQLAEAQSALAATESQLVGAKATLLKAQEDYARAENLFNSRSLTKSDFEQARTRLDTSQSQVDSLQSQVDATRSKISLAQAQLDQALIVLGDCSLKAPRRGQILQRKIEVGDMAAPGTVGFVLSDTSTVKTIFGVPDRTLAKVHIGDQLTITSEGLPGRQFSGTVTRIYPAADSTSRVFDIELTLPNPGQSLKVGMIASLELAEEKALEPVTVVPLNAIVRPKGDPQGFAVMVVVDEADRLVARSRTVTLGDAYGNLIAVQGVQPGERVVTTGGAMIQDGETVRILE